MSADYQSIRNHVAAFKPQCLENIKSIRSLIITPDFPYAEFFVSYRQNILQIWDYCAILDADPELKNTSREELAKLNKEFYASVEPVSGYPVSITNPDYAAALYGAEMGSFCSAIYTETRGLRQSIFNQNYLQILQAQSILLALYAAAIEGKTDYQSWLSIYKAENHKNFELKMQFSISQGYNPEANYFKNIVTTADLSDLRYLYRYGIYLSEYDFAMAEFVSQYPADQLASLAKFIVQSWVDGFVRAKKDYTIKRYATVLIPVGMERLGKLLIAELSAIGLESKVPLPNSVGINRQLGYDHRFDNKALNLNREYLEETFTVFAQVIEQFKDVIALQAGPVYVELFGETPFSPESKTTTLKLSPEQQNLSREQNARYSQLYSQYAKREESSFTIIAFPSPEIGDKFSEIFADTLKINLLDSMHYAKIQQHIIDVLDTADFVQVKGKAGNDTDIKVKMHPLSDPEHQTLFENCVADVNIPVGEVFTSPMLAGTNGVLHVADIYLDNLRYFNLRIEFKDGWVSDYSCSNFSDSAEGKKYMHENLLLPHDSLPIGEFAIGTNTTAYQIARKHDILALLPILIIEKMGPHFAIGDTCFSHEEDAPHPSFMNGKEMIAVENEKSATRKNDPINAYTQQHMDITLPYEMLESITAVAKNGTRTDIIRNGRFVVPGTEELNIPLDEG
ncbi:MAG: aminopeptidase [Candidatus Cloacimonas sp.]|jgi:hypothetical protein|nr:aminopeptidase [Candidatus Cloacimonas sp.]